MVRQQRQTLAARLTGTVRPGCEHHLMPRQDWGAATRVRAAAGLQLCLNQRAQLAAGGAAPCEMQAPQESQLARAAAALRWWCGKELLGHTGADLAGSPPQEPPPAQQTHGCAADES